MISRRALLRGSAGAIGLAAVGRAAAAATGQPPGPFAHGVASGDPRRDGVVLWTRVTPPPAGETVAVRWLVATDPELADVVASGETTAAADGDHTVHVTAGGLEPATTYWYGFESGGERSPVGRTRTAPADDDAVEVRLGVVSCGSYAAGPFTVYRRLSERDVDLVVHLGDWLYETDASPEPARAHVPNHDPVTLDDYRARHAQYRTDPDLQALLARHPVAAVWDDHDVAGNAWAGGAANHDPARQGLWADRRNVALQAWLEWIPVRRPDPEDAPTRIWRTLPLGGTGRLVLLDTRHDGRAEPVSVDAGDPAAALVDPDRRIMSAEQESWLLDQLGDRGQGWTVIANQVVLSPLAFEVPGGFEAAAEGIGLAVDGAIVNPDQWDGYPVPRERIVAQVAGDVVVLTGDIHSSWALDVPGPSGAPVAAEIVVPSTTAASFARAVGRGLGGLAGLVANTIRNQLDHVRWVDLEQHGYVEVSVAPERVQADWWHVDLGTGAEQRAASWTVTAGRPGLAETAAGLARRRAPAGPGPGDPSPDLRTGGNPLALAAAATTAALAVVAGAVGWRRRRRS